MKKINVGNVGYGWAAGAHMAAIDSGNPGRVSKVCSSRTLDAKKSPTEPRLTI